VKSKIISAAIVLLIAAVALGWIGTGRPWLERIGTASRPRNTPVAKAAPLQTAGMKNLSPEESNGFAPVDRRAEADQRFDRSQRADFAPRESTEPYVTILDSLGLSQDQLQQLRELILERQESAGDAAELSKDYGLDPGNASIAQTQAEQAFDQQITEIVGHLNDQTVVEMLSLTPQLADINGSVGKDLGAAGVPLTAEQSLQLADAYKKTYVAPSGGAGSPFDRTSGFDPQTGLAAADREVLARASLFLTPSQLGIVQVSVAKRATAYAMASR
jgi:hypothetical protein